MKDTGMDAYRLSIAWSRIFPNGTGEINHAGVEHYNNVIDALLAEGQGYLEDRTWATSPSSTHRTRGSPSRSRETETRIPGTRLARRFRFPRLDHLGHVRRLEYIHELFAYRKSLAKCDYVKFDSDLSGIFTRIKCEEKWPEVSDNMLETALAEHLKLLCQLSDNTKATGGPTADCKVPEILGNDLEEAIDAEYQARLLVFNKKRSKMRLKDYHAHKKFEHVAKQVFQSHAFRDQFLPQPAIRKIEIYALLKHQKTSSEDWSIAKLMQEKLQLNGKIKPYGLLLGVGAAVIAAAVGRKKYAADGTET